MDLSDYSNFQTVLNRAKYYYGDKVLLLPSTRKTKKYMIYNPQTNKYVHFGAMGYIDYTKYIQIYDLKTANKHRMRYLNRAVHIKGDWRDNSYSPNYLSMLLLWQF
jgi:hypothetical protein